MESPVTGSNPYEALITSIYTLLYRQPSSGFKTRMIVLCVINALTIVLIFTYSIVVFNERRRPTQPSNPSIPTPAYRSAFNFWIFKRVDRSSGKLIIPNIRVLLPFFTTAVAVVWVAETIDSIQVFINHEPMTRTFGWRAFAFAPMFGSGWLFVWNSMTTFLMTIDRHLSFNVSSTRVNLFFITGFVGGLGLAVGMSLSSVIQGEILWNAYVDVMQRLLLNAVTYPNLPPESYPEAMQGVDRVRRLAETYFRAGAYEFGASLVLPLAVLAVNLASIGLCRVLQKQIDYNKNSLASAMTTEHRLSTIISSTQEPSASEEPKPLSTRPELKHHRRTSSLDVGSDPRALTMSQIRKMSCAEKSMHHKEKARTIVVLSRARWELLIFSVQAAVITLFILASQTYLSVVSQNLQVLYGRWSIFELAFYQGGWCYSILTFLGLVLLLLKSWQFRDRKEDTSNDLEQAQNGTRFSIDSRIGGTRNPSDHHPTRSATSPLASVDSHIDQGGPKKFINPWARRKSEVPSLADTTTTTNSEKRKSSKTLQVNFQVERVVKEEVG